METAAGSSVRIRCAETLLPVPSISTATCIAASLVLWVIQCSVLRSDASAQASLILAQGGGNRPVAVCATNHTHVTLITL